MNQIDQQINGSVSIGSGLGALITSAKGLVLELFGVPLPVVLAALTGACGARIFLAPAPFWRALASSSFWTATGAFSAQFALWVAGYFIENPPTGAMAFLALVVAALGQRAAPIIWENGGEALKRFFDARWGKP